MQEYGGWNMARFWDMAWRIPAAKVNEVDYPRMSILRQKDKYTIVEARPSNRVKLYTDTEGNWYDDEEYANMINDMWEDVGGPNSWTYDEMGEAAIENVVMNTVDVKTGDVLYADDLRWGRDHDGYLYIEIGPNEWIEPLKSWVYDREDDVAEYAGELETESREILGAEGVSVMNGLGKEQLEMWLEKKVKKLNDEMYKEAVEGIVEKFEQIGGDCNEFENKDGKFVECTLESELYDIYDDGKKKLVVNEVEVLMKR